MFILDALSTHVVASPKDAEAIIERVLPRLQHANSAVVLSAVKVGPDAFVHVLKQHSTARHSTAVANISASTAGHLKQRTAGRGGGGEEVPAGIVMPFTASARWGADQGREGQRA